MATRPPERSVEAAPTEPTDTPDVECCETVPGKFVFVESGESERWIATDTPVDVRR
jgi:hypothetical protein